MPEEIKHINILTVEKFLKLKELLLSSETYAMDIESTGYKFMVDKILCISFSWAIGKAAVVPLVGRYKTELWKPENKKIISEGIKEILESPVKKILHNGKFDLKFFIYRGCNKRKVLDSFWWDTIIARSLINEESKKGLEYIAIESSPFGGYEFEIVKARNDVLIELNLEIKAKNDIVKSRLENKGKTIVQLEKEGVLEPSLKITDITYDMIPTEILWKYAAIDADVTFRGQKVQQPLLIEEGLDKYFERLSMPQNRVLIQMELNGIKIDRKKLDKNIEKLRKEKDEIYEILRKEPAIQQVEDYLYNLKAEETGKRWDGLKYRDCERDVYISKYAKREKFNVESPKQKQILFFEILKAKPVNTSKTTGDPKTDAETLEALAEQHPMAAKIRDYMSLSKFLSNFLVSIRDRIDIDGRLRTDYQQFRTVTGRLASNNPNLQNIPERKNGYVDPKVVKEIFIAEDGWTLCKADYKALEFRMEQQFAQDPELMSDLIQGLDIHRKIASHAYGVPENQVTKLQRHISKQIVFGLLYGRGARSVAKDLNIPVDEAQKIINYFFHLYPKIKE